LEFIDVQSVDTSRSIFCLYGANAFNGILFMTSQSPFTSQGITAYAKFGQTSQKLLTNDYVDYGIRMAHASETCRKANFTYLRGTDWYAKLRRQNERWQRQKSCEL
jgi:hypothetical protein